MTFGERLREARLAKGLTQSELGEKIGVAKSTLAGYEKGSREPDLQKIRLLLETLDIDANELFGVEKDLPAGRSPEEVQNADTDAIVQELKASGVWETLTPEKLQRALRILKAALFEE